MQEWIQPLNSIDACLSYYIQKYPSLLLIGPVKRRKSRGAVKAPHQLISKPAESMEDVQSVPADVRNNICVLVRFLAAILLNASNKSVFNTVEELVDLLAAADDDIAAVALEALCNSLYWSISSGSNSESVSNRFSPPLRRMANV